MASKGLCFYWKIVHQGILRKEKT